MFQNHILSVVLFLPLAGAILLLLIPKQQKNLIRWLANLIGFVGFLISLPLAFNFNSSADGFQFVEKAEWKDGSMPMNAVIEKFQALGSVESSSCGPNLNNASLGACGGMSANLQAVPSDCGVTKLEEGRGIVCSKRDLALGPGSLFVLRNNPATLVAK